MWRGCRPAAASRRSRCRPSYDARLRELCRSCRAGGTPRSRPGLRRGQRRGCGYEGVGEVLAPARGEPELSVVVVQTVEGDRTADMRGAHGGDLHLPVRTEGAGGYEVLPALRPPTKDRPPRDVRQGSRPRSCSPFPVLSVMASNSPPLRGRNHSGAKASKTPPDSGCTRPLSA